MTDISNAAEPPEKTFLGHPRGLVVLFFAEMWERFSYYGMRALLVLYLTQHFLMSDGAAQGLYASYAALVYLMPVIGGLVADRFLGSRKAVTIGALLLVAGHFLMAFEGPGAKQYIHAGDQTIEVLTDGRGADRKLYTKLDGDEHALVFQTESYGQFLNPVDGSSRMVSADTFEVVGDKKAPTLSLGGQTYNLVPKPTALETDAGEGIIARYAATAPDGTVQTFEEVRRTHILITEAARVTPEEVSPESGDATLIKRFEHGAYELETEPSLAYENILFLALSLIIIGVGLLKPNISTVVGDLYKQGDPRRDAGFTLFYVGINLGAFVSTIVCGYLGAKYGWNYGFGLAGIGMLLGLTVFWLGQGWLEGRGGPPNPELLKKKTLGLPLEWWAVPLSLLAVVAVWGLLQLNAGISLSIPPLLEEAGLIETTLLIVGPALFLMMFIYALLGFSGVERSRMLAALVMIVFSVVFWTLFEQAGSSLTLFADRNTTDNLLGLTINSAQTQSFNPLIVIIFGPILSAVWLFLGKARLEPSTPLKFAMALILVGLGFLLLVWAAQTQANSLFKVGMIWLFLTYVLHTIGELFLSPVGLSMITKLSAVRVVGLMMGVWFLSSSLAHTLAGVIAAMTASDTVAGVVLDPKAQLETYIEVFQMIGIGGIASGVVLLLLSPLLKKAMQGVH